VIPLLDPLNVSQYPTEIPGGSFDNECSLADFISVFSKFVCFLRLLRCRLGIGALVTGVALSGFLVGYALAVPSLAALDCSASLAIQFPSLRKHRLSGSLLTKIHSILVTSFNF
jgi:hypothetical protein